MTKTIVAWAFLLFGIWTEVSFTQSAQPKSKESYKDIIQKAQNLTLSQEREQASQILIRAMKNENLNKKAQKELTKTLNEITTVFFTEKSQRLFEYAKTLFREAPAEAIEKFNECLALEPHNVQAQQQIARLFLFLGRCEEAETTILKSLALNPYSKESKLLNLQAKTCLQKNTEIEKILPELIELQKTLPAYYHTAISQYFYNKGDFLRAQVELQKASAIDANFPEIYYWESLVQKKLGSLSTATIIKYVKLCKTFTKKDFKAYDLEPRVCQEYKNFELEYKNELEKEEKRDI